MARVSPEMAEDSVNLLMSSFTYNSQWEVHNVSAIQRFPEYPCCPGIYPYITYGVELGKREGRGEDEEFANREY